MYFGHLNDQIYISCTSQYSNLDLHAAGLLLEARKTTLPSHTAGWKGWVEMENKPQPMTDGSWHGYTQALGPLGG